MAFPHLRFPRVDSELPRKGKPAFIRIPPKDFGAHSSKLRDEADGILRTFGAMSPPPGIKPELIFKIRTEKGALIQDEELLRSEFSVLGKEDGGTLVLFANEKDLAKFKERLSRYGSGPEEDKDKPTHSAPPVPS